MLTKEECLSALDYLCACACELADLKLEDWQSHNQYEVSMLDRLINEHFDNPPLKFDELKKGMWVWDDKYKTYVEISETSFIELYPIIEEIVYFEYPKGFDYYVADISQLDNTYEENRFYRKQVNE